MELTSLHFNLYCLWNSLPSILISIAYGIHFLAFSPPLFWKCSRLLLLIFLPSLPDFLFPFVVKDNRLQSDYSSAGWLMRHLSHVTNSRPSI